MYWTETQIAENLGNKLFRMQVNFAGDTRVVDVNQVGDVPAAPMAAPRWSTDHLVKLVQMKRAGLTNMQISLDLGRDVGGVAQKWAERDRWMRSVDAPREDLATLREIACAICRVYRIQLNEFTSIRRTRHVAEARLAYYWLGKNFTGKSLPQIGEWAGRKHHSTVVHGIRTVNEKFDTFRSKIELCMFDLGLKPPLQEAA